MSWEHQGRQYHQWFGHGTSDASPDLSINALQEAARTLPADRQASFRTYLAQGGAAELREAFPLWATYSPMRPEVFAELAVGNGFGPAGTAALQRAARAFGEGNAAIAGAALAEAIGSETSEHWRYAVAYARDQALYSSETVEPVSLVGPASNLSHSAPQMQEDSGLRELVETRTPLWGMCHERCAAQAVGRGYRSDAPLIYRRYMWACGAFE